MTEAQMKAILATLAGLVIVTIVTAKFPQVFA